MASEIDDSIPQAILCRWATVKLGRPVAKVELDEEMDWGWSEYTPGSGWSLTVVVFPEAGERVQWRYDDAVPLIHEVCRFAALAESRADRKALSEPAP
jgi:hypothetical protein